MATDTVPNTRTLHSHFWQLPLFALGVAAAILAWMKFPLNPETPADQYTRALGSLKQTLERKPLDLNSLEKLVAVIAEYPVGDSELTADSRFLIGSAFTQLAEANPDEVELWKKAADQFMQADATKLADPIDQKRFTFRYAKVQAALKTGDAKSIHTALMAPPTGEEVEGERRRLLAENCLRLSPPDTRLAKDELKTYLTSSLKLPAATVARYQQRLADLHLSMNEPKEARAWLKDIGAGAAPDVQALAKLQLGQIAAAENNWKDAVTHFEAALLNPALPKDRHAALQYQTGLGYLRLKNLDAAKPFFELAGKESGPVGQAAAIRLTDLAIHDPTSRGNRSVAVDHLTTALKEVTPGSEFQNPYLTIDEARATCEETIQVALNETDYPSAVRAAGVYQAIAVPGRAVEKRADANTSWATKLQQNPTTVALATEKFHEAATDYGALAATFPNATGKADFLRRAAQSYRLGGNEKAAATTIDQLTQLAGLPDDVIAAAWVEKGESLIAGNQFKEGESALKQAMAKSGPAAATARVKLGVAYLDQARTKVRTATTDVARSEVQGMTQLGQDLLSQAANASAETASEKEAQQQALFELGKLLLQQSNIPEAESRFRQLLQAHPTCPLAGSAKLYLGSSLLLLARGDHQNGRPPADADRKLGEAQKHFESLSDSQDVYLRTQGDIRLANTTFLLKKYDEMPALCDKLTQRYQGKVEELIVLSMLYSSYTYADRREPAAATLAKMLDLFGKLPDTAFPGGAEEYTRTYWQKQWFDPLKVQPKP